MMTEQKSYGDEVFDKILGKLKFDPLTSVATMEQTLDTLDDFVGAEILVEFDEEIQGFRKILTELRSSKKKLKQQFMSDLIGDALRPFTSWTLRAVNFFTAQEFSSLQDEFKDTIRRYFTKVESFYKHYDNMQVCPILKDDENFKKAKIKITNNWKDWKERNSLDFGYEEFLNSQIRIVFRYNFQGRILMNGFSSFTGIFVYDNLERNICRAEDILTHEMSHNSLRHKKSGKSLNDSIMDVLMLSPLKRSKNVMIKEGYIKRVQQSIEKFRERASMSIAKAAGLSTPAGDRARAGASSSANTSESAAIGPPLLTVGPTKQKSVVLVGTNGLILVNKCTFTLERRIELCEAGDLFEYLYLKAELPHIPDPFCYDTELEEETEKDIDE